MFFPGFCFSCGLRLNVFLPAVFYTFSVHEPVSWHVNGVAMQCSCLAFFKNTNANRGTFQLPNPSFSLLHRAAKKNLRYSSMSSSRSLHRGGSSVTGPHSIPDMFGLVWINTVIQHSGSLYHSGLASQWESNYSPNESYFDTLKHTQEIHVAKLVYQFFQYCHFYRWEKESFHRILCSPVKKN